jgi:hypothetical protein
MNQWRLGSLSDGAAAPAKAFSRAGRAAALLALLASCAAPRGGSVAPREATSAPLTAASPTTDMCSANVLVGSPSLSLPPISQDGSNAPPAGSCALGSPCAGDCTNRCILEKLVASVPDSGTLCFPTPAVSYGVSGVVSIRHPVTLRGERATIHEIATGSTLLSITASRVRVTGLHLVGAQPSSGSYAACENGIAAYGGPADPNLGCFSGPWPATPLVGLQIDHNEIEGFGNVGVQASQVANLDVSSNNVHDIGYGGILVLSGARATLAQNRIDNVSPGASGNAYGIAITRDSGCPLGTCPRSTDVVVSNNVVTNIPIWEAYDTHGGQRITFVGNTAYNVKMGVSVGVSPLGESPGNFIAPLDVSVIGNVLAGAPNDANTALGPGISFTSEANAIDPQNANAYSPATGVIAGNVLKDFGDPANAISGGIYVHDTQGLVVANNSISRPSPSGINLYYSNYNFAVTGNTISQPAAAVSVGQTVGVNVVSYHQNGFVGSNAVSFAAGTSPSPRGMYVTPSSTISIAAGSSWIDGAAPSLDFYDPGNSLYTPLTRRTSLHTGNGTAFSTLGVGTLADGYITYCYDCAAGSNPCQGGSTGAFAKRLNGTWVCN